MLSLWGLGLRDGGADNDDFRSGGDHGFKRVGTDAAGERNEKPALAYLSDRVDMQGRSVPGQAHIRRRVDHDIAEAFRKGGIRGQQFRLAGFGDGVEDDRCAEGRSALANHLMRRRRGAG